MIEHEYDALIVGAGGAGLFAALEASKAKDLKVAVLSKLYPVRSHTGAAQGGISAALGNVEEDHWEWHMFDTVKGGDYLVDQDAAEILAREAIETIYDLEHYGLPFDRTPDGRISQRRFGGHTHNYGKGPVRRACHAADRTGHMILQTLYQQCLKNDVHFFNEFQVVDLLIADGACYGVVAWEILTGELHLFRSKATMFATGGWGKIWKVSSNAHTLTGDGAAVCWRRGIPMEDMEFYQFHPTGIYRLGILLSEAARGEGAILRNHSGERFMERYSPTLMDLAPRDIISRAIITEIREGRGVDGKDYVHLDFRALPREVLEEKLPEITSFARTYLGVDPAKDLTPIQPTAHYAMGGIPTDIAGRVIWDEQNTPVKGFYSAGECACVSVHGANRLGTNSLVDILVFGRRAGRDMVRFVREEAAKGKITASPDRTAAETFQKLLAANGKERVARIREDLQVAMMDDCGIFRSDEGLRRVLGVIGELYQRFEKIGIEDRGRTFNQDVLESWELGCMLDCADATVRSALNRQESRGGHTREDFPNRDDATWMKHTLLFRNGADYKFTYKPVTITKFQPQERKY